MILKNSQPQVLDFKTSQLRGHSKALLAVCESTLASLRHISRNNADELNDDELQLLSITSSTIFHSIRTVLDSVSSLQYLNEILSGGQDPLDLYLEERVCIETEVQSLITRITDLTNQLNLALEEKDKITRERDEFYFDLELLKKRTVDHHGIFGVPNEPMSKWTIGLFHKKLEITIR
jgi:chromosome segregation ATPase